MKIFVGNLNFKTTQEDLFQAFPAYGTVERADILTDRDTGRSRGFGFVEMTNVQEAQHAIQSLNGATLNGRAIQVNEARPKPDAGFGGGGGHKQQRGPH